MSLSKVSVLSRLWAFSNKYPITKGMVSYAALWPISSVIQQTIAGKRWDTYDWGKTLRFSLFGAFFVAPTLYLWVRTTTYIWPQTTLRTAATKALVEQVTYGPAAMCCFFFGMTLLDFKSVEEAKNEVREKFWPTYKVGVCVWPILQTINFGLIPERNRVPFVSLCSLMWTCFLAYMKELKNEELKESNV